MAFQFSQDIVNQLSNLLTQAELDSSKYAEAYSLIAATLTEESDLDSESEQVRLWFLGASEIKLLSSKGQVLILEFSWIHKL